MTRLVSILLCSVGLNVASARIIKGDDYEKCSISAGVIKGYLNEKDHLPEASGLAYSRRTDGVLWSHNDHGADNRVFAISEQGDRLADVTLEGAENNDWEDIAVNVEDGVSYVFVGDTGNNNHDNEVLTIYKFPEPAVVSREVPDILISKDDIEIIQVTYPDFSYDCETLTIDPRTGDILLFTKDREEAISEVYRVPSSSTTNVRELEHIATLPLFWVDGGDISPSGNILALTNKQEAWSFSLPEGQGWVEYLASGPSPCVLELEEEEQREAIAVTESGYWTTSECGQGTCPIWYYAFN